MSLEVHHFPQVSRINDDLLSEIGTLSPDKIRRHLIELIRVWRDQVLEVAIFFPIWLLFAVVAIHCFSIAIINWCGHVEKLLLLKLLDAQQNQPDDNRKDT